MLHLSGLTLGIFLLIGVGALGRRIGLLKYEDRDPLNNIIIFLALPALIFTAARQTQFEPSLLIVSAVALTISLLGVAVGYLTAKILRLKGPLFGAFMLVSGVGNTGYLGYPLAQALFGQKHLVKAVFYDIFGTVFVLFTVGIYFASKHGRVKDSGWRLGLIYATPNLLALGAGFATVGLKLPLPIDLAISSLADSTVAVIMLSIGLSLSGRLATNRLPIVLATLLKLVILPAIALAVGFALDLPPIVENTAVLQASMPIALMTFIIGDKYDLDRDFLSGAILATTLLSMLTIPGWQSIALMLRL